MCVLITSKIEIVLFKDTSSVFKFLLFIPINALSNFNDGSCRYISDRKTTIQVDTSYVNFPPITQVNFVVNQINGKSSNLVYEMQKLRENLYQFELPTNFLPGTKLNFSFQKITPDVYNVDTGREESDQPKEILISFDLNIRKYI